MRFWLSGPRFLGVRPGISFSPSELKAKQPMNARTKNATYIYVIEGDHNMVKIGTTTNPTARLASLRTGSAFPIKYAFVACASSGAMEIEKEAHSLLSHHACNGEWFDVSPELAISAVMGAAAKLNQSLVCEHISMQVTPENTIPALFPIASENPHTLRILGKLFMYLIFLIIGISITSYVVYKVTDDGPITFFSVLIAFSTMFFLVRSAGKRIG